jgi:Cu2+-exporting ATPase
MLGDGANDTLAFSAAWCRGTPAVDRGVLEQRADFYILGSQLSGLSRILSLGFTRRRAAVATVSFSILYNAAMVSLALCGLVGPLVAAIVMPLSSILSVGIVALVFKLDMQSKPAGASRLSHSEIDSEGESLTQKIV